MIRTKWLMILFFLSPTLLLSRALDNTGMVPLLSVGGGVFNALKDPKSVQFQMELKTAFSIAMARPFVGTFLTTNLSYFLYAGIGWDLHFSKYLVVNFSFAPGLYLQGHGKDLGYPLEFRTCVEAAYKFQSKARLGLQFYHLSNASISPKNPGAESVVLFYAIPL